MKIRWAVPALAAASLLGACARHNSTNHASTSTIARPVLAATAQTSGFDTLPSPKRPDARTEAAITRLLIAVFVHPRSAQCTSVMTSRYVTQAFGADAMRSGISPLATCRVHQRLRGEMAASMRQAAVPDIAITGGRVHAIVRGANGYPVGVTLARHGNRWRLDGFGSAIPARGQGAQISPTGSLYAYRIPPGFVSDGTRVGPVDTTGAAFSSRSAFRTTGPMTASRSHRRQSDPAFTTGRPCALRFRGSIAVSGARRSRASSARRSSSRSAGAWR